MDLTVGLRDRPIGAITWWARATFSSIGHCAAMRCRASASLIRRVPSAGGTCRSGIAGSDDHGVESPCRAPFRTAAGCRRWRTASRPDERGEPARSTAAPRRVNDCLEIAPRAASAKTIAPSLRRSSVAVGVEHARAEAADTAASPGVRERPRRAPADRRRWSARRAPSNTARTWLLPVAMPPVKRDSGCSLISYCPATGCVPWPAQCAPRRTCSTRGTAGTARAARCCGSGSACRRADPGRTRRRASAST